MSRRHPLADAFDRGELHPDDPRWSELAADDAALRAVAARQLDAVGLGGPSGDGPDADAIALAALGLAPDPVELDPADAAFVAALRDAPAGALVPAPAEAAGSTPLAEVAAAGAPGAGEPGGASLTAGMGPPHASVDAQHAVVVPIAAGHVARRRGRAWAPLVGLAALAAALGLTVLTAQLMLSDDDATPAAVSADAPGAPAKTTAVDEAAGARSASRPPAEPSAADEVAATKKAAAEKAAAEKAAAEERAAAEDEAAEKEAVDEADDALGGASPRAGDPAARADQAPAPKARRSRRAAPRPAAAAKPSREVKVTRRKPAARKKESTDSVDALLGALDGGGSKPAGGGRAPAPAAAAAPAGGDRLLPEQLTRRQILTVVKRNARGVQACKAEEPSTSGNVLIRMTIGRSGRVSSAQVQTAAIKGTPMGACIERTVRAFRFPPFSGEPMSINMPFAL